MSNETDVFPGTAEDVTTDEGMSIDDAAASAYDDQDRARNGIAEGERENLGKYLKGHADAVGVSVIDGLNSLIEPAVALRHGTMQEKRAVLGHLVDEYQIQDVPAAAQSRPVEYGPPATGADGQPVVSEGEALVEVEQFIAANPVAQDEQIQDHMLHIIEDMRRQGFRVRPKKS